MMHEKNPEHEAIARRAYEYFVARGCEHGHDLEDWVRAEGELRHGIPGSNAIVSSIQAATAHNAARSTKTATPRARAASSKR